LHNFFLYFYCSIPLCAPRIVYTNFIVCFVDNASKENGERKAKWRTIKEGLKRNAFFYSLILKRSLNSVKSKLFALCAAKPNNPMRLKTLTNSYL